MERRTLTRDQSFAALITAVVVTGTLLTACGSSGTPGSGSPPSANSRTAASATTASGGHFVVVSASFVSADQGFVLGESCPNGSCDTVYKTTDRGRSWTPLSSPVTGPLAPLERSIYFADASDGWIYGSLAQTFVTHDGGSHWSAIPMQGVETITSGSGTAYLFGVACPATTGNCSGSGALYRSPVGSDRWSLVPGVTPVGREGLSAAGSTVVVTEQSGLAWSPDGSSFSALPNPCSSATIRPSVPAFVSAWNATSFDVVCAGEPKNNDTEGRQVFVTNNDGHSYEQLSGSGTDGVLFAISAAGPATAFLTTWSAAGTSLFRLTKNGQTTEPLSLSGGTWVFDLQMNDASHGGLVYGKNRTVRQAGFTGSSFSGSLYLTDDGGRTWRASTITR